jgi:hypothetical protein
MLSDFGASLSFDDDYDTMDGTNMDNDMDAHGSLIALPEGNVNVQKREGWVEKGELGDSCCFGTRTVDIGLDCVWKLHGGIE